MTILGAALLLAAAAGVYAGSLRNPFIFDDLPHIRDNADLRQDGAPWRVMFTKSFWTRPVLGLTLAANYALGGLDVRGYRAVNVAVHLLAALALAGLLRRTLRRIGVGAGSLIADGLALATALLWTVHPLQTQSVTYIVQRGEAMMGLFYLLTLYGIVRAAESRRPRWWYAAAVAACALGMGSKQVMITAPLVALLYDRTVLAGSLGEALRRRWGLYAGLAATWLVILPFAALVAQNWLLAGAAPARSFMAQRPLPTPWEYLRTEPGVLVHYLRLAVWPHPLCLDHFWPVARTAAEILPHAVLVTGLLGAAIWAAWRRPAGLPSGHPGTAAGRAVADGTPAVPGGDAVASPAPRGRRSAAGLAGLVFFIILAPTSSVFPIEDPAFEHRMYLPLASVAALAVCGTYAAGAWALGRVVPADALRMRIGWMLASVLTAAAAAALGYLTILRNEDYGSDYLMWSDIAAKRPDNPRAQYTLGNVLWRDGRLHEAIDRYREAIRLDGEHIHAHNNLANVLMGLGRYDEAVAEYRRALAIKPDYAEVWSNLGTCLALAGRRDEAIACFREALRLTPGLPLARNNLDRLLAAPGPAPGPHP